MPLAWWVELATLLISVVGVAAFAFKVAKWTRRAGHFLDDWFGEEARPGHPARPGVVERMERVEKQLVSNGGESLRDAINRIEKTLGGIDSRVAGLERKISPPPV